MQDCVLWRHEHDVGAPGYFHLVYRGTHLAKFNEHASCSRREANRSVMMITFGAGCTSDARGLLSVGSSAHVIRRRPMPVVRCRPCSSVGRYRSMSVAHLHRRNRHHCIAGRQCDRARKEEQHSGGTLPSSGFISCPDLQAALGGKDIFFHVADARGLELERADSRAAEVREAGYRWRPSFPVDARPRHPRRAPPERLWCFRPCWRRRSQSRPGALCLPRDSSLPRPIARPPRRPLLSHLVWALLTMPPARPPETTRRP